MKQMTNSDIPLHISVMSESEIVSNMMTFLQCTKDMWILKHILSIIISAKSRLVTANAIEYIFKNATALFMKMM